MTLTFWLIVAATIGPSATLILGALISAARYQRRLATAEEYADGCLRTANQSETWGFRRGYDKGVEDGAARGRLDGISTGINLRDQIENHFGDYSQ